MPKILSSNYITLMIFCQLPSFFAFCPSEIDDNILFLCFNIEYCVAGSLNFSLENLNHHVYAFYCRFASGLLAWILSPWAKHDPLIFVNIRIGFFFVWALYFGHSSSIGF